MYKVLTKTKKRLIISVYLLLLLLSYIYQGLWPYDPSKKTDLKTVKVKEIIDNIPGENEIRLAYRSRSDSSGISLILIHGSPFGSITFKSMLPHLQGMTVYAPDMPGFGHSTYRVENYSIQAHARYLLQFMDQAGIDKAHLLGYSMGGGVILHLQALAPERVESLIMLSAIGVQELELLGDHHLNHSIHAAQLLVIRTINWIVPHFGWLHRFPLNSGYARNFYDSDQRPFRKILQEYRGPMLICQGTRDRLVPMKVAYEHHRIVPQSALKLYDAGHAIVISHAEELVRDIREYILAPKTIEPDSQRLEMAAQPFSNQPMQKMKGSTLIIMMVMIALATLISEDLTCIGAGLMVAKGIIGYIPAALAAFLGIFIGDILLYLAGKWIGAPALQHAPLKWIIHEKDVVKSAKWFDRRGRAILFTTRFLPGSRLPTYFSAGLLKMSLSVFASYLLIAAFIWAPALVALSTVIGNQALKVFALYQRHALWMFLALIASIFLMIHLITPLFTFKGRRRLKGKYLRLSRWEFWPPVLFYPPLVLYIIGLGLRFRSMTLFTAVNPAIPAGGFINESKSAILKLLKPEKNPVARYTLLHSSLTATQRYDAVLSFMQKQKLDFPVVLKPDIGQRGSGVTIIKNKKSLQVFCQSEQDDLIAQEYIPGHEFGIFYVRYPDEKKGRITSITHKTFPSVTGDGRSSLETLILKDERAVCMAPFHLDNHAEQLLNIPEIGKSIQLVELGTHCRGSLFLDGWSFHTQALAQAIDRISASVKGFYFGRYDIRTPEIMDFKQGKNFKIVELNGVTSEETHIYDPKNSLCYAYSTLMRQWRTAFEIAKENRKKGCEPTSLIAFFKMLFNAS